jgi:2'-5' RNA ligase
MLADCSVYSRTMERIRSFIAIELPRELKQALTQIQQKLITVSSAPVKWVDPGNIHLTLKFLGDIDTTITGSITSALEEAVKDKHPFDIEVSGLGVFPDMKRVQVIWVGLTGELDKLSLLQKHIEESLVPLGFPKEKRPFTPHLTIARIRDYARPDDRLELGQLIDNTSFTEKYKININTIHLIRSQLTREGPIYSKISTVTLK